MNARDDEWHEETDCRLVGGPCDGDVWPMKRGWSEYVKKNHHLAMSVNLGDSVRELDRKWTEGEIQREEDIEKHFDEQRERDKREGVNLPPGGHKYRRGGNRVTFVYVGPVTIEEVHRWSRTNVIPHQHIYKDKAAWERMYGKYIDGTESGA